MLDAGSKSTSVLGLRLLQSYVPLRTDRSANVSASSIYIRSRTLVRTINLNLYNHNILKWPLAHGKLISLIANEKGRDND